MTAPDMGTPAPAGKAKVTAADVRALLRVRYAAPEWALLFEVSDTTGAAKSRSADAVAMSLWPSRGLELHGFEIKVTRGDWLREKKAPEKAEAIARFCDRWWVVAPAEVVLDGELPVGWGLLVAQGSKLVRRHEAPLLDEVQPVSRAFLAALMRRAHETTSAPEDVKAEILRQVEATRVREKSAARQAYAAMEQRVAAQEKAIAEFEAASGVFVSQWNAGQVGEAVRLVLSGGLTNVAQQAEQMRARLQEAANSLGAAIAQAPGAADDEPAGGDR